MAADRSYLTNIPAELLTLLLEEPVSAENLQSIMYTCRDLAISLTVCLRNPIYLIEILKKIHIGILYNGDDLENLIDIFFAPNSQNYQTILRTKGDHAATIICRALITDQPVNWKAVDHIPTEYFGSSDLFFYLDKAIFTERRLRRKRDNRLAQELTQEALGYLPKRQRANILVRFLKEHPDFHFTSYEPIRLITALRFLPKQKRFTFLTEINHALLTSAFSYRQDYGFYHFINLLPKNKQFQFFLYLYSHTNSFEFLEEFSDFTHLTGLCPPAERMDFFLAIIHQTQLRYIDDGLGEYLMLFSENEWETVINNLLLHTDHRKLIYIGYICSILKPLPPNKWEQVLDLFIERGFHFNGTDFIHGVWTPINDFLEKLSYQEKRKFFKQFQMLDPLFNQPQDSEELDNVMQALSPANQLFFLSELDGRLVGNLKTPLHKILSDTPYASWLPHLEKIGPESIAVIIQSQYANIGGFLSVLQWSNYQLTIFLDWMQKSGCLTQLTPTLELVIDLYLADKENVLDDFCKTRVSYFLENEISHVSSINKMIALRALCDAFNKPNESAHFSRLFLDWYEQNQHLFNPSKMSLFHHDRLSSFMQKLFTACKTKETRRLSLR